MQQIQYNRQILYYRWALILAIIALLGYTFYFEYDRYLDGVNILKHNIALYIRLGLIVYFISLLLFLNRIPRKIFNILGFLIMVPLGWGISIISFFTVGYEGITVTGFIFLVLWSAIVFDFHLLSFSIGLFFILSFHFTLLSFYPESQSKDFFTHIFLLSMSSILGFTTCWLVNIIKDNETKALKERELLLKEIHHRVKNNLQVVSSLMELQSGSIRDEGTKTAVKNGQSRVKSIALIHQLLYQSDMITNVDFSTYLQQLVKSIHNTFAQPGKKITYEINSDEINLDIDTAVPLGLMINELVTNAYKYAFTNKSEGNIKIDFKQIEDNCLKLAIKDNGIGFPDDFNIENTKTLGFKLINILSRQIKAKLNYETKNRAEFSLVIPR
jgi:two-component sensor histidine kinase